MSHIALNRGLRVLHHLVQHKSARFKDITKLLDPISPASQMRLLRTLTSLGEIEKDLNQYRLSPSSVFRMASSPHPFALKPESSSELDSIVRQLARETSYPAALFGWITSGTITILNSYSPIGSDTQYRPAGEEWPLVPFHDYAQLFLAYAPGYTREDAFFRWNPYLKDEYKGKDFKVFIECLNEIRKQGFTVPGIPSTNVGSIVYPVFLHDETIPRYAIGILVKDKPDVEAVTDQQGILVKASGAVSKVLRENISPKQLVLDLPHAQKGTTEIDPHP